MGKCCWRASLAIQQLFPIQILLPFSIFKLTPNVKLGSSTYSSALSVSGTAKVPGIKFKGGEVM